MYPLAVYKKKEPWNKGKLVGQKTSFEAKANMGNSNQVRNFRKH
jgi:hypothetical protein